MEGVVRYRILGSHPAASGRFYTIGFPGEFMLVQQLLDEVVKEHQINLSAFKAVVTRVPPATTAAAAAASETGGGAKSGDGSSGNAGGSLAATGAAAGSGGGAGLGGSGGVAAAPETLYPGDRLRNYDNIAVTVTKRSLGDDEAAEAEARRAEAQNRLRSVEDTFGLAPPPTSRRGAGGDGRGRGAGSGASPTAAHDPLALQRATALAVRMFPTRPGQQSGLSGPADPSNDHVCVLCGLSAFREALPPCCRFPACVTCLESGQAMMLEEEECPICGRNRLSGGDADGGARGEKHAKREPAALERKVFGGTASSSAAAGKRRLSPAGRDGEAKPSRARAETSPHRASVGAGRSPQLQHQQQQKMAGVEDALREAPAAALSPSVKRMEEELRAAFGATLAHLDDPAPVAGDGEARRQRTKSAALAALDGDA